MAENEIVGWHHRRNALEPEQAPGDGEGPRSLVCCSPWGCSEHDCTTTIYWLSCLIFFLFLQFLSSN